MAPGLPGGAGRFIPRTTIRCISVLLSSAKILEPGSKESKVKESSGKRFPFPMPAYLAGWQPRGEWAQGGKTCLSSRAGVKTSRSVTLVQGSCPSDHTAPSPSSQAGTTSCPSPAPGPMSGPSPSSLKRPKSPPLVPSLLPSPAWSHSLP